MASTARTQGLQAFRRKVLERLPQAAKDAMREANEKSADDMIAMVKRSLSGLGDEKAPELDSTLEKRPAAADGLGVEVTIGGPNAPYPLHLEAGHKAPDGSHVPPKPFWNPAKQLVSKRHKGRARRALSKAIKITAGAG
jgi:hypothetical protein